MAAPAIFGERLTVRNIEDHLQAIRGNREAYAVSHAGDLAWLQSLDKSPPASTAPASEHPILPPWTCATVKDRW